MKVKVLAISGSPRKGNTQELLKKAVEGAVREGGEVKEVFLSELNYSGCMECGGCDETGVCIIEDDLKYFYQDLMEAQVIILSAPIFFAHLPSQVKAMIDRFQAWWIAKYVLKKPFISRNRLGAFLCVGGQKRRDFFECAKKTVKAYFATANISYEEELFKEGIDKEGEILKDEEALKEAYEIGRKLVVLAKSQQLS